MKKERKKSALFSRDAGVMAVGKENSRARFLPVMKKKKVWSVGEGHEGGGASAELCLEREDIARPRYEPFLLSSCQHIVRGAFLSLFVVLASLLVASPLCHLLASRLSYCCRWPFSKVFRRRRLCTLARILGRRRLSLGHCAPGAMSSLPPFSLFYVIFLYFLFFP